MEEYHPISLYNVKYKILTKVLANRLKKVMPNIISQNYDVFLQGRQIYDGIIVVHKIIHSAKERKEPTILIKIDLMKAFDRVSWDSLLDCLEAFGFGKLWQT